MKGFVELGAGGTEKGNGTVSVERTLETILNHKRLVTEWSIRACLCAGS